METGRHISDAMRVDQIQYDTPGRLRLQSVVYHYPDITVGELRKMNNHMFMRIPNVGTKTRDLIRTFFGPAQSVAIAPIADVATIIEDLRRRVATLEYRVNVLATDSEGFLVA